VKKTEKPRKLAPYEPLHWFGACCEYLEEAYDVNTDDLWNWIQTQHSVPHRSAYFLYTNPTSPGYLAYFKDAPLSVLHVIKLLHEHFSDTLDSEGITFWME